MRMTKLSEFAYFVSTKIDVKKLTRSNYIGVDNMLQNKNGITKSEYLPDNGYAIAFQKNDILIGNIRPYLKKIWLATFDGGCSQDVLCLRCNNSCLSGFIFSLLSQDCFFDYVMKGSKGTRMARGDKKHILNYKFCDISNKEQIGQLITNLNKKIFLNNQINDNLLQSLIVFFDRIMTKSLNSGEANQNKLANVCTFTSGYPFKTENYVKNGIYKLYTIKNVQNGFIESNVDSYLDNIPKDMDPKCLLSFMDILISLTGNVGRSGLVYDDNCLLNQRVLKINAKEDLSSWIYILLQNNSFINYAVKVATGTSQKNLSPSQVGDFPAIIPSNKYLKEFNDIAQPTLRKIALNNKENLHLKKQRDYLLPLLLNGQVVIR